MAESLMVDTCVIRAPSTFGEMDDDTGLRVETPGAVAYSGRCKVNTFEPHESTPESGDHVYTLQRNTVHIPATETVPVGHMVTITACALDLNLVGRTLRVAATLHKSMATANRLQVEEVTE
jgi:hypothetical protein